MQSNAISNWCAIMKNFDLVIRPKAPKTLPKVLSKQDLNRLFSQTQNLKHLLLLKMA